MPTAPRSLVYYPDARPGISRRRAGRGFSYRAPDGTRIEDKLERRRIDGLGVPPAYEDVWICPLHNGHLQATGRDGRARKQYRYHAEWTAFRSMDKFGDLAGFGAALPSIRRHIRRDLNGEAGERDYAVAAILAMIDRMAMRIGHASYSEENGSYGATTLRRKHLDLGDDGLSLDYVGKGGKRIRKHLRDKRLARVLHDLGELPGAGLVSWTDERGEPHEVTSCQVNERLAEITGEAGFTAKTFRTWAGTVAALDLALKDARGDDDGNEEAAAGPSIAEMSRAASARLGNTPAIARKSYIHPDVIALSTAARAERRAIIRAAPAIRGLRASERALLGLLEG
ncbi:DNA topoisomerase IB [Profundibacterium mesophilum]|uniref:DNA topoisomerase n=1 Tax=Profundibacterium mesophilum KAUST100406-0324 TaxID=1037889 RepID=A0A921NYQ4_9RHOB|nr:DNA topoisomerase IB [Profundibacterium mesophilum]KAF0675938.1 DNA topoisomerase [Profundibacterium mesophilum KAUST100406-0324]